MATVFIDTNIFLRHLLQDHPEQSPKASAFFSAVERGEVRARTAETVVFETVFTLQRRVGISRADIRNQLLPLVELPGIALPDKKPLRDVFNLYADYSTSFADAYHAVLMRELQIEEIVSFDKGFDRLPGIRRIEPS